MSQRLKQALNLLNSQGFISGLNHCHVPNLMSLVLKERDSDSDGMLRIFYAPSFCDSLYGRHIRVNNDDAPKFEFRVLPHNHRQDITLHHLFGYVVNYDQYEVGSEGLGTGMEVHEHVFSSGILNGKEQMMLKSTERNPCVIYGRRSLLTHTPLFLKSESVHTVTCVPDSAWLIDEGELADHPSYCYSQQPDVQLDSAELYKPLTEDELKKYTHVFRTRLKNYEMRA